VKTLVPLTEIKIPRIKLREVEPDTLEFISLKDDIEHKGIILPIAVRESEDGFELIDGLQRYTIAKLLGFKEVPVHILEINDDEVLYYQICANEHRVPTKPSEIANALRTILNNNPEWTVLKLASSLNKSAKWIRDRLGIGSIEDASIIKYIDNGDVPLTIGVALSKLPAKEQQPYFQMVADSDAEAKELVPIILSRVKEIKESDRIAKDPTPPVFTPVPKIKHPKTIQKELESPETTLKLVSEIEDKKEIIKSLLTWVLSLDPDGVKIQKELFDKHFKR
jgi:ParB/RepB/Spo0J family partition protein